MLLTKPSLVLLISTAMFVLYGDIIIKFWSLKSRKEQLKRKQLVVSRGDPYFATQKNLFKGFSSEPVFDKTPPVILTGFKICNRPGCKMSKKSKYHHNLENLLSETRMRKVFRYLKDSKYVLCILIVYFFSWVPWLFTFFLDTILVQLDYYNNQAGQYCGNFSVPEAETTLLQIQENLKHKENLNILFATVEISTVCRALGKYYEDVTFDIVTRLYVVSGAFSCELDPLIYALWYQPVRGKGAELYSSVKISLASLIYSDIEDSSYIMETKL